MKLNLTQYEIGASVVPDAAFRPVYIRESLSRLLAFEIMKSGRFSPKKDGNLYTTRLYAFTASELDDIIKEAQEETIREFTKGDGKNERNIHG